MTASNASDEDMQVLNQLRWIEYFLDHGGLPSVTGVGPSAELAESPPLQNRSAVHYFFTRELLVRWLHGLIEKMPSFFTAKLTEWLRQQPARQKRLFQIMDAGLLRRSYQR